MKNAFVLGTELRQYQGHTEMNTYQKGIGVVQFLLVAATLAAVSVAAMPENQAEKAELEAAAQSVELVKALNFAGESKRRIAQSFKLRKALPRTADEVTDLAPSMNLKPESVRDVKFQPDFDGNNIMIMVYLNDGVVDNLLGGEQYLYIAGIKSEDGNGTLEWQCGARNVDMKLMPKSCQG